MGTGTNRTVEEAQPEHPASPLLELDGLNVQFATSRGVLHALSDVSLTLGRGETLGIVGESGSGKSVLARTIMDLLPKTATVAGSVRYAGRDVRTLSKDDRRHFWGCEIAMVFQDPMTSLNPTRKIGTQITDPIRHHLGTSARDARIRARELLDMVRIPEASRRLDQYPHELSGGMRQRVMIAVALSCSPKLVIADEPTTALDVTVQKQILDLMASLQRDLGTSMILITHDLGVVAGRTDRVAVMYAGQVVELAGTTALFGSMAHPYTDALLRSIPRIESSSTVRLQAIDGRPPSMIHPPAGCRFTPRCARAREGCEATQPSLEMLEDAHAVACHFPLRASHSTASRTEGTHS